MLLGDRVLTRINGELKECEVIEIYKEDLKLKYEDKIVVKKFWEVAKPKHN